MKRAQSLRRKLDRYLFKGQLFRDQAHMKLEKPFLIKSRKNFTVANLLFNISEKEELKKLLCCINESECLAPKPIHARAYAFMAS